MPNRGRAPRPPNALAQELATALLAGGWHDARGRRNGQQRGGPVPTPSGRAGEAEWTCGSCSTTNWLSRRTCRRCAAAPVAGKPIARKLEAPQPTATLARARPAAQAKPTAKQGVSTGARLPVGSVRAEPQGTPGTAAARATGLEHALAAARAAGASAEAVAGLAGEAAEARRAAADGRPLGARLDSARALVQRAGRKLATAEEAAAAAAARCDAARKEVEDARAALQDLEAEVARTPPTTEATVGASPGSYEEAVAENRKLRAALASLRGEQTLDEFASELFAAGASDVSVDDASSEDAGEEEATPVPEGPRGAAGPCSASGRRQRAGSEPPARRGSRSPRPVRAGREGS